MNQRVAHSTVKTADSQAWELMPNHVELYHKELTSAQEADELGVRLSSILWEQIGPGGAVLPHYHNVAEIIHITKGEVLLYREGQWLAYQAGDTFIVPAKVVHSVANRGAEPSEQLSIFLPVEEAAPRNVFFDTTLVNAGALPACIRKGGKSVGDD